MFDNIIPSIGNNGIKAFENRCIAKPAPVLWPDMYGEVTNILICMYLFIQLQASCTDLSFMPKCDQMKLIF